MWIVVKEGKRQVKKYRYLESMLTEDSGCKNVEIKTRTVIAKESFTKLKRPFCTNMDPEMERRDVDRII